MTKPLLILQFRPEPQIRQHEQKCFKSNKAIQQMSPSTTKSTWRGSVTIKFFDAIKKPLPSFLEIKQNHSAVILGGSSLMLSLKKQNTLSKQTIKNSQKPILQLIKADFPTFGICFGAQLIAHHLGIPVVKDPKLAERGTYPTKLTQKGQKSPLFKNTPQTFLAQLGHLESITYESIKQYNNKAIKQLNNKTLKHLVKILATGTKGKQIHAFQIKNNIFATIFHPELNYQTQLERAKFYLKGPKLQNFKQNKLIKSPHATQILTNFLQISNN